MAEANEVAVKQEDVLALLKGYDPPVKLARERDALSGRYRILLNQPLPDLGSPCAKAYGARDDQAPDTALYALVHDNTVPLRQKNIKALKGFRHPNLVALLDEGIVEISTLSEARYVTVLEKPVGQSLAQMLSQGKNPVSETTLTNHLLRPLVEILIAFSGLGISHNRINLSSVYLNGNSILLGECIGEPSGFSQDSLFEPIDRLLASPWAKPDYAIGADCYALAVLALHLTLGFKPFAQLDKASLTSELLNKGSYHTLAIQWDLSEAMQDFFQGLLNDARRERWDPQSIESWLAGRKFNLIPPSLPGETSRGFEFAGETYFSRKALAQSMFRHWQEARALLPGTTLAHWLETNLHKADVAETVTRIAGGASSDTARSERHNNDLLARIIMVLDPTGPIRLKHLAVTPEGMGLLLEHAFLKGEQEDVQTLTQMIESDLAGFWVEQQKGADYSALIARLQKIRLYMRMNSPGFGVERCLYDLHPGLPCQSPLVKRYCVMDLADLLHALDTVAAQKAAQEDCMDRHIAGFIASRLEVSKEIRITELDAVPGLKTHPKLIGLKLLMRAQLKAGEPVLKGLSHWVAARLFPLLDTIHKRSLRHKLQANLRDAAGRGSLQAIATILLDPLIFVTDYNDFQKASAAYAERTRQIDELKTHTYLARHARMAGRGIAQTVAYTLCLATVYITFKSYFHF